MKREFERLLTFTKQVESLINDASAAYFDAVQAIANRYGVVIATGQMSDVWQVQHPKTGEWLREGESKHPALKALERLDSLAREIQIGRIGPSNLERYEPQ